MWGENPKSFHSAERWQIKRKERRICDRLLLLRANKQTAKLTLAVFWSVKVYSVTVYAVSSAQFYDAVRNSIDTHLTDGYKIWILFSAVMCCTYCHITVSVRSAPESRGWRRVLLCALSAAECWEVCRQCTRTLIEPNYICCEIGKHPQNTKQGPWLWNRNKS